VVAPAVRAAGTVRLLIAFGAISLVSSVGDTGVGVGEVVGRKAPADG
jgi:hypothetical protein